MAADANTKALQVAINRFSTPGGFAMIGEDGLIGPNTMTGALNALRYLATLPDYQDTAAAFVISLVKDDGSINTSVFTPATISGLATYLQQSADALGASSEYQLPNVMAAISSFFSPSTPAATTPSYQAPGSTAIVPAASAAGSMNVFGLNVSNKVVYAAGGLLALVVIALVATRKKPGAEMHGW